MINRVWKEHIDLQRSRIVEAGLAQVLGDKQKRQ